MLVSVPALTTGGALVAGGDGGSLPPPPPPPHAARTSNVLVERTAWMRRLRMHCMESIPLCRNAGTRRAEHENARWGTKILVTVRKNFRAETACAWRQVRLYFF